MAYPEIDLGGPGLHELTHDVDHVRFTLLAKPPTLASAQITMFESPTSDGEHSWVKVESFVMENHADENASPQYITAVKPGMDYCFSLAGKAVLAWAGFDTLTVGLSLEAAGYSSTLNGMVPVKASHARINGLVYVRINA